MSDIKEDDMMEFRVYYEPPLQHHDCWPPDLTPEVSVTAPTTPR